MSFRAYKYTSIPTFETRVEGDEFIELVIPLRNDSIDDPDSRSHSNFESNGLSAASETSNASPLPPRPKGPSTWLAINHASGTPVTPAPLME
ncbi:UNVERIFIED_CONTAM: hypothetical protein Sradi_3208400 [Sesamum radiatum]|uniref:Uncharacterized protein n=1 Tax=Sesamum radiatum TaxID=300843 RepID=A0AAW2RG81_SESRA